MTVTISRLYDSYSDAEKAVRGLEAAGVPHSDISIVANNSDNWYSTDKKVDRYRDGVDDRAEGAATGAGLYLNQRSWVTATSIPRPPLPRRGFLAAPVSAGVSEPNTMS